jgi:hypothetical protein
MMSKFRVTKPITFVWEIEAPTLKSAKFIADCLDESKANILVPKTPIRVKKMAEAGKTKDVEKYTLTTDERGRSHVD